MAELNEKAASITSELDQISRQPNRRGSALSSTEKARMRQRARSLNEVLACVRSDIATGRQLVRDWKKAIRQWRGRPGTCARTSVP